MDAEAVATFSAIAGCDAEFAATFLMAHNGNLEQAVNAFMGDAGVGAFGGSGASLPDAGADMAGLGATASSGPAIPAPSDEERLLERAPMDQYRDTLMDPAQRLPTAPAPPTTHHLEAFRDTKTDAKADDPELDPKHKPKTLADIYRPPTEMCFQGTFDQLRQAGREQGRWLLVNIQSPTEFASQQLNADTWRDETLKMIIEASFLFWQQYFDRPEGEKYCRYYLANQPQLPHIGLLDPVTGQLIKSWTGFKDAERLMDKLAEISDTPPTDGYGAEPIPPSQPATAPPIFPHAATSANAPVDDEDELAAAIAASLGTLDDAGPSAPAEPEPAWPEPPPEPEAGRADTVTLRVRLPSGNMTRAFLPTHTLHDVLCAVHHSGTMALSMRKTYQLSTMGCAPVTDPETTLVSIGLSGRVMVNLSELP